MAGLWYDDVREDDEPALCWCGKGYVGHEPDPVWFAERMGTCDRCQCDGLEVCEAPGPGTFDYCRACWRPALGHGGL
jgi:hypothetical protein